MNTNTTYKIRPAGRHILTIGRDLIQDNYAAVVELVKNAYDADSPDVDIKFAASADHGGYTIVISDHGHGMSRNDVINKWMVPSTQDKRARRTSPAGRTLQGSKGVGRYAASILGRDLRLETITAEGEKTTVYLVWDNFVEAQYLDDVEIRIETTEVSEPSGTRLIMSGDKEHLAEWNQKQFSKLKFELKKLKSPMDTSFDDDEFRISLTIDRFPEVENVEETIEPYLLFDLFDYKISGSISSDGTGTLTYSSQKARNIADEELSFNFGGPTGCGKLDIDVRVYDRDPESIDALIGRGLKDELGNYVGKREAGQLLREYNGIGVYRNGFRIRPLGDPGFDWLNLDKRRVQNPSLRIGSEQVIGYVQIQSEDQSQLIEKSARDGLKENPAFNQFTEVTKEAIKELEIRRFEYREKVGLGRPILKVEQELEEGFSFNSLKKDIQTKLIESGSDKKTTDEIIERISQEEKDKYRIVDNIQRAVAIYQGQAALGQIISVILHQGRKPLNYLKNDIPDLRYWYDSFLKTGDSENLEEFMQIADSIGNSAEVFVDLFGRLDPLAAKKRAAKKSVLLKKSIQDTLAIFQKEMKFHNVSAEIIGPDEFRFLCWQQDISAIFTSLIENSVYWMDTKKVPIRQITIELLTNGDSLIHIDYRDTGPGIEPSHIADEMIFRPQFTTKPDGTGLGLTIAGECAYRNGLELKAFESEKGAYFRLQSKMEDRK